MKMLGFGKSVILIVIVFLTLLVDTFTTLFAIFNWAKTKNDKDIVENFFHKLGSSIYVIVAIFIVTVILNIIGFGLCFYIWRTRNAQKKETDELEEVIVHKPASRSDQKLDSPIESTVFAPTDISVPASTTCQSTENGQKEENDELVEVIVHKPARRSDQKLDSPIESTVVVPMDISVPASTTCQAPENAQKKENNELARVILHKPARRSDQKLDSPIESTVVVPMDISVPFLTTCQAPENAQKKENNELARVILHKPGKNNNKTTMHVVFCSHNPSVVIHTVDFE
ncbi:uncharacterized protein ACNLHF_013895 [Anomaloglossus baeobatrachus]